MLLTALSVRQALAAFAAAKPTPGSGAACALASATGAALLIKVARLPKTRANTDQDRAILFAARDALVPLQQQLADAVDADIAAYDQVGRVVASLTASGERLSQDGRAQHALRAATEVPLFVMRLSVRALAQGEPVAARGHRAARSDVDAAIMLLVTGAHGSASNVRANLTTIADRDFVDAADAEANRLAAEAGSLADSARRLLT